MLDLESSAASTRADATTPVSQRKSIRHLCIDGSVMRLAVRPEFRGRLALLVDVSATGIGFLLQDSLAIGAVLVFDVRSPGGTDPVSRIARVRNCQRRPPPPEAPWLPRAKPIVKALRSMFGMTPQQPPADAWFVGCEFDRPMDATALAQFMESLKGEPCEDD